MSWTHYTARRGRCFNSFSGGGASDLQQLRHRSVIRRQNGASMAGHLPGAAGPVFGLNGGAGLRRHVGR